MRQIATIFLVTLSLLGLAIPTQPSNLPVNGTGPNVQEINRQLRHYDLVTLDAARVADQVRRTGQLTISTSEGTFELSLSPNEIRAVNYRAEEVTENGTIRRLEGLTALIYKGTVRGMDNAQARFTIDGNVVEGLIITSTQNILLNRPQDIRSRPVVRTTSFIKSQMSFRISSEHAPSSCRKKSGLRWDASVPRRLLSHKSLWALPAMRLRLRQAHGFGCFLWFAGIPA